jgi:hypothetical protein
VLLDLQNWETESKFFLMEGTHKTLDKAKFLDGVGRVA